MKVYYKATYTYKFIRALKQTVIELVSTLGRIVMFGIEFIKE